MSINLRWFKNRKGFSWVIALTGTGIIKASLRLVNTRKGLRVVRSIYLVPKRGSEEQSKEIFSEYYDTSSFMEILNNATILVNQYNSNMNPLQRALLDVSKIVENLESIKKTLEEVINDARIRL